MHERIARRQEKSKAFMEQSLEDTTEQIMRRHGVRLPPKGNQGLDEGDLDVDDDFDMGPRAGRGGSGAGSSGAPRQGGGGGGGGGGYSDDDMAGGPGVVDPEVRV